MSKVQTRLLTVMASNRTKTNEQADAQGVPAEYEEELYCARDGTLNRLLKEVV